MAELELRGVTKRFGAVEAVKQVDLKVADGEFVVFVGPSGCGKSTLLRIIAGLEDLSEGEVIIGGENVVDRPPSQRGIAMVFQTYALYPHRNVYENMAYGLKLAGRPKAEVRAKVENAARILQLEPLLNRKPSQLSGGQRQRVAIGRAIVRDPKVFLFDEPLSNLDAALRGQMRIEIADLHARLGSTMVYVTHDQVEAMTMADRIVILNGGRVEQQGAPLELYHHPANLFVAGFLGAPRMNLFPARVTQVGSGSVAVAAAGLGEVVVPAEGAAAPGMEATLGVRPHDFNARGGGCNCEVRVELVEPLGHETMIYGALEGGAKLTLALPGAARIRPGATLPCFFEPADCHLFDSAGVAFRRPSRAFGPAPELV